MFDQFNNKNYRDFQNLLANKMNLSEMNRTKIKNPSTGKSMMPAFNRSISSDLRPEQIRNLRQSEEEGRQQAEEIDQAQQAASLERLKAAYKEMGLDYDEVQRARAEERTQTAEEEPTEQQPQTNPNHGTSSTY